jgi:hypothetical protein
MVTRSSLLMLIMMDDVGDVEPWQHHYCLCAMMIIPLASVAWVSAWLIVSQAL